VPDPVRISGFWARMRARGIVEPDAPTPTAESFGDSVALADELLDLILHGPKRATAGAYGAPRARPAMRRGRRRRTRVPPPTVPAPPARTRRRGNVRRPAVRSRPDPSASPAHPSPDPRTARPTARILTHRPILPPGRAPCRGARGSGTLGRHADRVGALRGELRDATGPRPVDPDRPHRCHVLDGRPATGAAHDLAAPRRPDLLPPGESGQGVFEVVFRRDLGTATSTISASTWPATSARSASSRAAGDQPHPRLRHGRPAAANSGHQGTAMALAPLAHVLFSRVMNHDPADPTGPTATASSCPTATPRSCSTRCCTSRLRPRARRPQGVPPVGVATPGPPRGRPHRRASRSPPGRSARGSPTPSAWRSPSASCAPGSAPRPSTTTPSSSPATAASWRASATRPPRSPATSGSAS
jgi:hypothetical protein